MDFPARLAKLGLELPPPPPAAANYIGWRRTGTQVWIAGVGPTWGREVRCQGRVGQDVTLEAAQQAARLTALNLLSHLNDALAGKMDRVRQCVKVFALVNCSGDYDNPHQVIDAGSQLLVELLGEKGRHARAVTAAPSLPVSITVEMDAIFEVE